jgi:two-component system, sensor histidine kinase and response regulator
LGVIHPDDKPVILEQLSRVHVQPDFQAEFRVLTEAGAECWLAARFRLCQGSGGTPDHIGVLAQDITQRVRTEQQLDEARAIYESLVQSIPIRVFRKNRQGRLVFCNKTYCQSLGKTFDELIGKTDDDLFSPELAAKYKEDDRQVISSGQPVHVIEEHPADDGSTSYVEVVKVPVKDARGNRIGIQGVFWDVSERINAQKKLERAKELAETASHAKSDFLASVSHEIRTPLNGVIGMTELLLESTTDREHREYLEIILQSGETLLDLINDLLDFSKIEAGKLDLEIREFDIVDLLADALRSLAVRAQAKNVELIADFDLPWTFRVMGDGPRLRQVVVNLVSNAIKFTQEGEVVFGIRLLESSAEEVSLLIEVSDTGIGIPKDKLSLIFEKFEQADKSTTREFGGTGLGLAISAKITEMMHSKIHVESDVGRGSRFYFELKLPKVPAELGAELPPDLNRRRGLIFATNKRAGETLDRLLRNWNCQMELCASQEELTGLLDAPKLAVDFAIVDLGFDPDFAVGIVRRIRKRGVLGDKPMFVLSAGQPRMTAMEELGIEKIIKPAKPRDLLQRLATLFNLQLFDEDPTTRHLRTAMNRPLRILLAEDNLINQRLACAILAAFGHQITTADDGLQAVELATRQRFDLILMDVEMPKLDGLEATRRIRQHESPNSHLPIIALSAHTIQGFREKCVEAGMDEFLSKPLRRELLIDVMERLTGHRSGPQTKVVTSGLPRTVDWRQAFETVGGDRRLLMDLINVFLEEHPKMMLDIHNAATNHDLKVLKRSAHGLKGALNYLGARQAADLAIQLEESNTVTSADDLQRLVRELQIAIHDLTLELEKFKTTAVT